jgi:hypothetical protein
MSSEAKQKRFEGEVQKWLGKFGFINYEDSGIRKRIYFSSHGARPDWRGSRAWVLAGIPVTFVRTKRHDDKTGELCDCALNLIALSVFVNSNTGACAALTAGNATDAKRKTILNFMRGSLTLTRLAVSERCHRTKQSEDCIKLIRSRPRSILASRQTRLCRRCYEG